MALLGEHAQVLGPLPTGTLLLETLVGVEELGAPYAFELGLLSRDPSLDPALVMGRPLAVGIRGQLGEWRYFHGVVSSFVKSGVDRRHTREPAFWRC